MKSYHKAWTNHLVSNETKIRMYNACVVPILTYNLATVGFTLTQERQLNAHHRKQMKHVLGIFYPQKISNEKLYEKTKTEPLSIQIARLRMGLFGHILRLPANVPAQITMEIYLGLSARIKEAQATIRGGRTTTIYTRIKADLQAAQLSFNTVQDLKQVRQVASSRKKWAKISQKIVERLKLKALDDIKRTTARAAVKRKERVDDY